LFPRTITPSLTTTTPCDAHRVGDGLVAGEALIPGPVYIKSDGTVWQSTGAAANAAAKVHGWMAKPQPNVNGAVAVWKHIDMAWGPSTATPGTPLYLSATKGELDTATTTGGTTIIAIVCGVYPFEGQPHAMIECLTAY
jgi:hypothetical protein